MTHARTHTHGANYNLPPASRAGDNKTFSVSECTKYPNRSLLVSDLNR